MHENQFYFNKSEAKSLKIKNLKIALKLKMTKQCDEEYASSVTKFRNIIY